MTLTQDELKRELEYNKETGEFKRLKSRGNQHGGSIVNVKHNSSGYYEIRVYSGSTGQSKKYKAHRLAWLYEYGSFPKLEIDHINGIRTDNRLSNLREVDRNTNQKNRAIHSNSPSGVLGVTWNKNSFRWEVSFKSKYIKSFDSFWDAVALRKKMESDDGTFEENHSSTKNINFI